jgi:hypothetical protein
MNTKRNITAIAAVSVVLSALAAPAFAAGGLGMFEFSNDNLKSQTITRSAPRDTTVYTPAPVRSIIPHDVFSQG